nr:MAG TPA: hypothetical protein [Crassvirales sp.]
MDETSEYTENKHIYKWSIVMYEPLSRCSHKTFYEHCMIYQKYIHYKHIESLNHYVSNLLKRSNFTF